MNRGMFFKKTISPICIVFVIIFCINTFAFSAYAEYGDELNRVQQKTYSVSFIDVANDHWAVNYISELVDRKVINGYPDGYFRPDDTITRAEFAKIMVNAAGMDAKKTGTSSFVDVDHDKWYAPFIEAAKSYLTGFRSPDGSVKYYPDHLALREDISVAIVKLKGYDQRLPDDSILQRMFIDYDGISESVKPFVAIAVESGLISGYPDKTFRAQDTITRAQACAILWRAYQYGNDDKTVTDNNSIPIQTPAPAAPELEPSETPPLQPAYKYSITTLFGGNGLGFSNGGKNNSQIYDLGDLVTDKNNVIYFTDTDGVETNLIRRYNKSSDTVDTFLDMKNFKYIDAAGEQTAQRFIPVSLTCDQSSEKMFASGYLEQDGYLSESAIVQIKPSVQAVVHNDGFSLVSTGMAPHFFSASDSVHFFMNDGSFIFGNGFALKRVNVNGTVSVFSNGEHDEGVSTISGNYIYSLQKSYGALSSYNMATQKKSNIWWDDNLDYDSVLAYNGSFYATKNSNIFKIGMDGAKTVIFDTNDVEITDSLPIPRIYKFTFDQSGNIIFYDSNARAVREISQN